MTPADETTGSAIDPAASRKRFEALVWPRMATVLRVARLLVGGNDAEAEDLAQDTMLRAYRGMGSFADGTDVDAWLMTILRHARVDRLRSPGSATDRTVSLEAMELDPAEPPHAEETWDPELGRPQDVLAVFSDAHVIHALQALPEEIRMTLLLVDVQQMDQRDAAGVLGVPVGTVKSRAHRGRAMLRQALLPLAKEMRLVKED